MTRKLLVLTSLFALSAILTGCPAGPVEPPQPEPVYVHFTGGLYEQAGKTTTLDFSVLQDSLADTEKTGDLSIGSDAGEFTISGADPTQFSLSGKTWRCTRSYSSGSCAESSYLLNIALQIAPEGITGATPSPKDGLVWSVARTLDEGNQDEVFQGTISSRDGNHYPVIVTAHADGSYEGTVIYQDSTYKLNGFLQVEAQAYVSKSAVASLLILSALDAKSKL